jgi:chitodextrinase
MNFTSPFNSTDIFFTKEEQYILFNSPLENTYFEMNVVITSYDFYTENPSVKTLDYKIPLFNNKASFLLGEIVDRAIPRMPGINLRSLFQYKPSEAKITIKEIDIATETIISTNTLLPIKFVSGYRPEIMRNNCAFLDLYATPRRATENGYIFLNMLLTPGTRTITVYKNNVVVDTITINVVSTPICSRAIRLQDYQSKKGDVFKFTLSIPSSPSFPIGKTINKIVYIFPDGIYSNYIAFEDEYRIKTIIELTGEYKFNADIISRLNKIQKGFTERNNKVSSKKELSLTINTGFILKEEELIIESLLDSQRAWLITGENEGIEIISSTKKIVKNNPTTALYSYDLEFIVNVSNYKPLKVAMDSPLVIQEIDEIPPTAPEDLTATNTTHITTKLNWTAATDANGVVGYDIYQDGEFIGSTSSTSYVVTGLVPETTTEFYVIAKDEAGNFSDESNTVSVTTLSEPDTEAPSVPTGLTLGYKTDVEIGITFTSSTDNVAVDFYYIYANGILAGSYVDTSVTGVMNVVFGDLSPNTTYELTVKAVDTSGNISELSEALTVTTDAIATTAFLMAENGSISQAIACAIDNDSITRYHNGTGIFPTIGDKIYYSTSPLYEFTGYNNKYAMANNHWIQIDYAGTVIATGTC